MGTIIQLDPSSKGFGPPEQKRRRKKHLKPIDFFLWWICGLKGSKFGTLTPCFFSSPPQKKARQKIQTCSPYSLGVCELKGSKFVTLFSRGFFPPQKNSSKRKVSNLLTLFFGGLWVEGIKICDPYFKCFFSPKIFLVRDRNFKPAHLILWGFVS